MIEVQTMMQRGEASHASPSPSFSSYSSSETLAEIAARVIEELWRDPHSVSDDETLFQPWENDHGNLTAPPDQNDDEDVENDDFEFTFVPRDPNASPVSADDIFYNGQIRPMYPIFDRTLLSNASTPSNDGVSSVSPIPNTNHDVAETRRRRLPLKKLMFEERETGSCSSSTSEADDSVDLEGVAEGTYCVWTPNSVGRKKSNSTGSASKRWKLRDLLLRSHSEGKDNKQQHVVLQVPSKRTTNKVANEAAKPSSGDHDGGASVEYKTVGTAKDHGDQTKRKLFLPYRQELVGLFANVNGLGRTLHPF